MTKKIEGAGNFFGGGSRQPYRAPDTLESKQFATVLDLVSEGEIEGFATPSKKGIAKSASNYTTSALSDVFLDGTPVLAIPTSAEDYVTRTQNTQNSDFNFRDVSFKTRFGSSNQTFIQSIADEELNLESGNELANPIEVLHSNPDGSTSVGVSRSISDNNDVGSSSRVDAVKVVIQFPQIQKFQDNGDVEGSSVELKIQLAYVGGSNPSSPTNSDGTDNFATVVGSDAEFDENDDNATNEIISGRSKDRYQKEYLINLDGNNDFTQVFVRVVRKTPDVPSADADKFIDKFEWASFTKVFYDKLSYPDCAYHALRVSSEQFSKIPERAYRIRGIKVRIPGESAIGVSANYSYAGTVVTVTTSSSHNLRLGDFVTVSGNNADINGFHGLTETPDPTGVPVGCTFKYNVSVNNDGNAITGTLTYKITPNVDLADGRINYPHGYVFGGTMSSAVWTSCPSMILLDLLTNSRYGFGTFLDPDNTFTSNGTSTTLDIQSFVAASRYANEIVEEEARFSCNVNIQNSNDAFRLINELAGVMRCMPIWTSGTLTITQDRPTDASYLFNLANVTDAGFSYSGASNKQRHTVIKVSFFNNETREIDYAVYGDDLTDTVQAARITKFGLIEKTVKAFGCTSEKQALRLAKAIVFAEEEESEVVSFSTSIDAGSIVRPGTVIEINDPVKSLQRAGGRINSISDDNTVLTVDDTTNLISTLAGTDQKISVIMSDGTVEQKNIDVTETNTLQQTNSKQIKVTSAFTDTSTKKVNPNTIWIAESTNLKPQKFRVVTVEEQDDINYAITAIKYNDGKYANIEDGTALLPRKISVLNDPPLLPDTPTVDERIVVIRNKAVNFLTISWPTVIGVTQYQVQYRLNNGNFTTQIIFRPDFTIENSQKGKYEFRIYTFNALGTMSSSFVRTTFDAAGLSEIPENVSGLSFEPVDDKNIRLRWNRSTSLDVIHGGFVYIKHNSKTDGSGTWNNSANLIDAISGASTEVVVPAFTGEYLLKFADDGGRFSKIATSILITKPDSIPKKIAEIHEEENNNFNSSVKSGVTVFGTNKLRLTSTNSTGSYTFANDVDLGADFAVSVDRILTTVGDIANSNITQLITGPPNGVTWKNYATDGNFSGPSADFVDCKILVQTRQSSESSFSTAVPFASGIFTTRFLRFSLALSSTDPNQNIHVIEAGYKLLFDQRIEVGTLLQTSGGTKVVTFNSPFFTGGSGFSGGTFNPSVGVSVTGLLFAETFQITNISGTGFTLTIKDKDDNTANVTRTFSYTASGFGKGV